MQELDDPFSYPDNLGVAICHAYMKVFVPEMRAQGCPNLTFADAIQVHQHSPINTAQAAMLGSACKCLVSVEICHTAQVVYGK